MFALHAEERYEEALRSIESASARLPEQRARMTFWAACLECRLERPGAALERLEAAVAAGDWFNTIRLANDGDLAPLRGRDGWQRLVAACERRRVAEQAKLVPEITFEPPAAAGAQPPPLVVALHMMGGDVEETRARWLSITEWGYALAMPRGTEALGPGEYGWGEGTGAQVERQLADLREAHGFDPARVVYGGASQGAGYAVEMALGAPLAGRGFIAIAGAPSAERLASRLGTLQARGTRGVFITGTRDYMLPRVREAYGFLEAAGLDVRLETIPGLGHDYPGELARSLREALAFIDA